VPLLGGEAAIKKPYRMALSYIYTLLGEGYSPDGLPLSSIPSGELDLMKQQLKQGVNCPPTSSAGRFFDGVSALLGVRSEVDYEAQAAVELEMLATDYPDAAGLKPYPYSIDTQNGIRIVRLGEVLAAIVNDFRDSMPVAEISLRFHKAVADKITGTCKQIDGERAKIRVALSGGVFQNRLLLRLTVAALRDEGFEVLIHRLVPCNDGGISLGQAVIANFTVASKGGLD
jgi:hydrogenase maturation protein HypF